MFSTIFYIVILFYQNLYSGLGYSFNADVQKVNLFILSKDYNRAFTLLNLIEKKHIFKNESIYQTKVYLAVKRSSYFLNANLKTPEDYIVKSLILSQNNHQESAKLVLREGLKWYAEKDTLTKLYELFSFISKNKIGNSEAVNEENLRVNKIKASMDSEWMLDILRRNEKFLSY